MILKHLWNAPYLLLMFATLFWGGNAIAAKLVADAVPPFTLSLILRR